MLAKQTNSFLSPQTMPQAAAALHPTTTTTPRAPHLASLACRRENGLGKDGGATVAGALERLTALTELGLR